MDRSGAAQRDWDLLVSPWHLDEPLDGFPAPAGAIALAGPRDPAASELDRLTDRYREVADAVAEVDRPLVLAGDCLTSLGLVAGLQRRHRDISLVWLDAHGDFNTPEISATSTSSTAAIFRSCGGRPVQGRPSPSWSSAWRRSSARAADRGVHRVSLDARPDPGRVDAARGHATRRRARRRVALAGLSYDSPAKICPASRAMLNSGSG